MLRRPDGTKSSLLRVVRTSLALLLGLAPAFALAQSTEVALDSARPSEIKPALRRREVTLGLGYGAIVSPRAIRNDASGGVPAYDSVFTGWMLEVTTRRLANVELGLFAWSTGGSSDGRGSYAHQLLRIEAEARWLPWGFGRIEPWIGIDLGLAAADDYAKWDATPKPERAHSASVARAGYTGGIGAGLRGRAGELVAFGLRGGLLYLRLPRPSGAVSEPGDSTGVYVVRPTDYGRRLWYSVTLSAEITVPD